MAEIKNAQDELYLLLVDLYLISTRSKLDGDTLIVPRISDTNPRDYILEMTERVRSIILYLS